MDFVITWVDGNDPAWQKDKEKYSKKTTGDSRAKRYRDWEFLKYWFRSIEECAPWVDKIHFITYGHLPAWLNTNHSKLHIVNHCDFIPEKYLPTFSCRPIELNLHRVPGLSDDFVYFNDDMFLLQKTSENDFFRDGLPCDIAILQVARISGVDENGGVLKPENYNTSNVYNLVPINRNFDKRSSIKENWTKWFSPKYGFSMWRTFFLMPWEYFTGFRNLHLPYSYQKKTFEEAWEKETFLMDRACCHKFRDSSDISSRMLSFWQIAKGEFAPRSPKDGKYFSISDDEKRNRVLFQAILNRKYKMICVNDEYTGSDFDDVKKQLTEAFDVAFPKKSGFEKE